MEAKTLICPHDPIWRVELDRREVFPDDPGAGTPAMLYGPRDSSATFYCALDTEEISNDRECIDIPRLVLDWMSAQEFNIAAFLFVEVG
ncbi:hypothetical protein ACUDTL_16920 [Stenotrophomonas pavanii]|uniref:hypothetical protein n=1 Tax=Stenotrophomonas pavanii TaxID=487698 RepID=UPI004043575B